MRKHYEIDPFFEDRVNVLTVVGRRGKHHEIEFDVKGKKYVVKRRRNKIAIYYDKKRLSRWFDKIGCKGLLEGKSSYYVAYERDKGEAIFHVEKGRISEWFDKIYDEVGLVRGESEYYVAERNGKVAIFDLKGKRISDWFAWIDVYRSPILQGTGNCYIASKYEEGQELFYYLFELGPGVAVFDVQGRRLSDWHYGISEIICDAEGKAKYVAWDFIKGLKTKHVVYELTL